MQLSPCGIDCGSCELVKQCGGTCHECKGSPFYIKDFGIEACPMYDCAVNKKGFKTCAECEELPCKIYYDWKDPSMTDEQHLESVKQRVKVLKESGK